MKRPSGRAGGRDAVQRPPLRIRWHPGRAGRREGRASRGGACAAGRVACPAGCLSCQTVQSASVGDRRAARMAGRRPARAPMATAAARPPAQACGGMTVSSPCEWA